MKTTIDNAGRLVIPKEIRTQAGLAPGMALDIRWRNSCIEIEPAPLPVELVRKGRLLVAVPKQEVDTLTVERIEETRQAIQLQPHFLSFDALGEALGLSIVVPGEDEMETVESLI